MFEEDLKTQQKGLYQEIMSAKNFRERLLKLSENLKSTNKTLEDLKNGLANKDFGFGDPNKSFTVPHDPNI